MSSIKLPIFHDDLSFQDRYTQPSSSRRPLDDIHRRLDRDFDKPWGGGAWDGDFRRMYDDFFQLKPMGGGSNLDRVRSTQSGSDLGSTEMLDDKTRESLFVEDPQAGGRKFQISFAVKDYDPNDISVQVDDRTLIVEAKHETVKDGMKSMKEFNRKIEIPKEVDTEKLSSRLSNDGVLTIEAPVPTRYQGLPKSSALPNARNSPVFSSNPSRSSPQSMYPETSRYATYPASSYPRSDSTSYQPPSYQGVTSTRAAPQYSAPAPRVSGTTAAPSSYSTGGVTAGNVTPRQPAVGVPSYFTGPDGKKTLDLLVELGAEFGPDNLVVKVGDGKLLVEAMKELTIGSRKSKSTMMKEFDLDDDMDPQTISANFMPDGKLQITAKAV